jgi:histidine triad (HIT) family protein
VASIFTRIIDGELPARFVWKDEQCVAFLSIRPLRPGHTLVVPRLRAQMAAFKPERVGLVVAGLEVPHLHIHVVPIRGMEDLDFANQDPNPDASVMDDAARSIREQLRKMGFQPPSA